MKKYIIIVWVLFSSFMGAKASCCVALCSSIWESASTWSCSQVPSCGDSVIIPAGITVTITTVLSYTTCPIPMQVTVAGTLLFQTGKKLDLSCGSVMYVLVGGIVDPGNGGGSSNLVTICGVNYWNAGSGKAFGYQCWGCSVLPIQLAAFNATCNTNDVTLTWATATEINNRYFTLERSDDGLSWAEMARINGAGTTSAAQYYKWVDEEPIPGNSYYRLKQTDFDGHATYPGTITSSCYRQGIITVYPNPSKGSLFCKIACNTDRLVSFSITDNAGRYVSSYKTTLEKGVSTEQLQTGNLAPGIYILTITFNDNSAPLRKTFMVSR